MTLCCIPFRQSDGRGKETRSTRCWLARESRSLRPPDCDGILTATVTGLATERIRRNVLSGLIHEYERAA
jgi:hypothetical protein